MKKNIAVLLSLCLLLSMQVFAVTGKKMLKLHFKDIPEQTVRNFYRLGLDVTQVDRIEQHIHVLVSEDEIAEIAKLGIVSEVLVADADALARQIRQSGYLDNFHTYDRMLQELKDAVVSYPNLAQLFDIGDSYEKTMGKGGYDIWVLKISDNVTMDENEPEVFYMANTHAREIITPEIILNFMHYLLDNYGIDPYVTYLVNERQIWLCPMVNPDGHEYVFTGANPNNTSDPLWWRKNKRDNNRNGIFEPNSDGVDLNRNFGYQWGYDNIGSSPNPWSEIYRGASAFSEPESQAIREFIKTRRFIINLSFHSFMQLWLYPWGYQARPSPDDAIFAALADSCVAYNNYDPGPGHTLYLTNGATDDWMYGEQAEKNKIYGFTPEVGNYAESLNGNTGFFPDPRFIDKQILENRGPMLYLAHAAGEEPIIEPRLFSDTENALGPYSTTTIIKPPIILTQPAGLRPGRLKLFYNSTGQAPFDSTELAPTGNANEYLATISGTVNAHTIYYYFLAVDSLNRIGHAPRSAPFALYSFKIGADSIPPVIVHEPIAKDQSIYADSIAISARVSDNSGLARVMLYYRQNLGTLDSTAMQPTETIDFYLGFIVPKNPIAGDLVEYRLAATDISNQANKSFSPDTGFYSFRLWPAIQFDFEADNGGFTSKLPTDWQWGQPTSGPRMAHSGQKLWGTILNGDYNNSSDSRLLSPAIDLKGAARAILSFWHWYLNESSNGQLWDGGNIKISADGGPFQIITPIDGYDGVIDPYNRVLGDQPAFGGPSSNGNFWHQELFDLTAFRDRSIVISFDFASDDNTTEPGWYIDDVQVLLGTAVAPLIHQTTVLKNTSDPIGPYVVTSEIIDDTAVQSANLFYSIDNGATFRSIAMVSMGKDMFSGAIPGQPFGTTVSYYIEALDADLNQTTDPPGAPQQAFQFLVTDRVPEIFIAPTDFNIAIRQGDIWLDSILVVNKGLLDLHLTVTDSLFSGPQYQVVNHKPALDRLRTAIAKLKTVSPTGKSRLKNKVAAVAAASLAQWQQIIYDPIGDLEGDRPGKIPDLVAVHAAVDSENVTIAIEFAHPIVSDSCFVLAALDIDQDLQTGDYPPLTEIHDLGADAYLFWNPSDILGLPPVSVMVLNSDLTTTLATIPIQMSSQQMTATIPLAILGHDDGNMNIGLLAFTEDSRTQSLDFAPDLEHGVIGFESGVPWLSLKPDQAILAGEDSLRIVFGINGYTVTPGEYQIGIFVEANDPSHPLTIIPMTIRVAPVTGIDLTPGHEAIPKDFTLGPNYPNPFNPSTKIRYQLPEPGWVELSVYNNLGQRVKNLVRAWQSAGSYEVLWDGRDQQGIKMPAGIYMYQLKVGSRFITGKMVLLP